MIEAPPEQTSDEATRDQLALARLQGDAFAEALLEMTERVADDARALTVGHYEIAVAVEKAEGLYSLEQGELVWNVPDANAHIEVVVRDASDGRFIPGLDVTVTVIGREEIGTHKHEFLWHPWLYHYGRNWDIPEDGEYRIQVHIDPPLFLRHDKLNGQRYAMAADAEFLLAIRTGKD